MAPTTAVAATRLRRHLTDRGVPAPVTGTAEDLAVLAATRLLEPRLR